MLTRRITIPSLVSFDTQVQVLKQHLANPPRFDQATRVFSEPRYPRQNQIGISGIA